MPDLATLGIVVNYTDAGHAGKRLGELAQNAEAAAKATDQLGRLGKTASQGLAQTKTATAEAARGFGELQGAITKLNQAFQTVQQTPKGLRDLATNLRAVDNEAKKAYESGKLTVTNYQQLSTASDQLSARIHAQNAALRNNSKQLGNVNTVSQEYLASLQQQQAMRSLLANDKSYEQQRARELSTLRNDIKYRHENMAALEQFKNKQIALQRETANSYRDEDRLAQQHIQSLRQQQAMRSLLANDRSYEQSRKRIMDDLKNTIIARSQQSQQMQQVAADYAKHDRLAQQHTRRLGMIEQAYSRVISRIKMFASFLVSITILMGFQRAMRGLISTITEFDQSLWSLRALTGATAAEVRSMGDAIRGVARDTKFSAGEVAAGMQVLGKAGFNAVESMRMITPVAQLATGALEDFETVGGLMATAMRAFQLETVEAGRVADTFANAVTNSKLTIDGLITAFGYVGAAGAQAGLTMEEVSGTLMVLADNGIRASTMGTGLRRMLLGLLSPNENLSNSLREVGMQLADVNPEIAGWENVLQNIAPLMWDFENNSVDMAKAVEFFGLRASQVAAILIRETAQGGALSQAIEKTKEIGAAARMAALQQEGLDVKFKNLADRVKNVALALGDAGLNATLHNTIDYFRDLTESIEGFLKEFPEVAQWVGWVASIVAVSVAVIALTTAVKYLGVAIAMVVGKWQLILGAIAAVITAISSYNSMSQKLSETYEKQALALRENVSILESWNRVLEKSILLSERDFITSLSRFVEENEKLSKRVLETVSSFREFQGETVTTMTQLRLLAGTAEATGEHIRRAFRIVRMEDTRAEILKFGAAFKETEDRVKALQTTVDRYQKGQSIPFQDFINIENIKKQIEEAAVPSEDTLTAMAQAGAKLATLMGEKFSEKYRKEVVERIFKGTGISEDALAKVMQMVGEQMVKGTAIIITKMADIIKQLPEELKKQVEDLSPYEQFTFAKEYERLKKDALEFRDFLLKNGTAAEEATRIMNEYLASAVGMFDIFNKATESKLPETLEEIRNAIMEITGTDSARDMHKMEQQIKAWGDAAGVTDTELTKLLKTFRDARTAQIEDAQAQRVRDSWIDIYKDRADRRDQVYALEVQKLKEQADTLLTVVGNTAEAELEIAAWLESRKAKLREDIYKEEKEEKVKKEKETATEIEKIYERALSNIQDANAKTFRAMMDDGVSAWSDLGEAMVNIMKDTLSQILAMYAQQQLVLPIMAQMLPGALGQVAAGQLAGVAGSGAVGSGVLGGVLGAGGLSGMLQGVTNPINAWGASKFGIGVPSHPAFGVAGPGLATLGMSALGGLGGGYMLGGQNTEAAMMSGMGTMLGAALMPILGPFALLGGGLLGGGVAGLMGHEKSARIGLTSGMDQQLPTSSTDDNFVSWKKTSETMAESMFGAIGAYTRKMDASDFKPLFNWMAGVDDVLYNALDDSMKDAAKGFEHRTGNIKEDKLAWTIVDRYSALFAHINEGVEWQTGTMVRTLDMFSEQARGIEDIDEFAATLETNFRRVVGVFAALPDAGERIERAIEEGASHSEAFEDIESRLQSAFAVLGPAIEAGLRASAETADLQAFQDAFAKNLEEQVLAAAIQAAQKEMFTGIVAEAFDEFGGLSDMMAGFVAGEIAFDDVAGAIGRVTDKTGEFAPLLDDLSSLFQLLIADTNNLLNVQQDMATELERYLNPLSAIEAELERIEKRAELHTAALVNNGMALDDAIAATDEWTAAMIAGAHAAAAAARATQIAAERLGLERRLLGLQGDIVALRRLEIAEIDESNHSIMQQIWAYEDQQEAMRGAEEALRNYQQATQAYAQGLRDELQKLEAAYQSARKGVQDYVAALKAGIKELEDAQRAAWQDMQEYRSLLNEELGKMEQVYRDSRSTLDDAIRKEQELIDARINAADALDSLINRIMGSTMAPVQSLEFFEKRYEQLLDEAKGAETADEINRAISNLTGFTTDYLDFAGAYGGDYLSRYNEVMEDLRSLEDKQRDLAEEQVDALDAIRASLGDVDDKVLGIKIAASQYYEAKSAFDHSWLNEEIARLDAILDETRTIEELKGSIEEYQSAKTAFDETWMHLELAAMEELLNGPGKSMEEMATSVDEYHDAKIALDSTWMTAELDMLEKLLDVNKSIEQLQKEFLDAQSAAGSVPTASQSATPPPPPVASTPSNGIDRAGTIGGIPPHPITARDTGASLAIDIMEAGRVPSWMQDIVDAVASENRAARELDAFLGAFQNRLSMGITAPEDINRLAGLLDEHLLSYDNRVTWQAAWDEQSGVSGARRMGGSVSPGDWLVGEDGPEIVSIPTQGYVHNAQDTRRMLSNDSGGNKENITVFVKIGDRELREVTAEVVRTDSETQDQIRRVANGR